MRTPAPGPLRRVRATPRRTWSRRGRGWPGWADRDDRVDVIEPKIDDFDVLKIHAFYVRHLLPDDGRGPVLGVRVTDHPVRHGAFVPQGWKLEYTGVGAADGLGARRWRGRSGPRRSATTTSGSTTTSRRCPAGSAPTCFEAFTMLAALSQRTDRVELGQLVTCVGYRNVGLLAKEAAGIDVMSDGRLILGLGAGWYEREYQAYGYDYPSAGDRLQPAGRGAAGHPPAVVGGDGRPSTAQHVHLDGAYCEPQPLRSPRPPILVGGGGEQVTLRIAARHADMTNWQVGLEAFVHKSRLLARYCEEIDRDPASIVRTHGPDCLIVDSRGRAGRVAGLTRRRAPVGRRTPHDDYVRDNLVGTVDQVAEKAQAYLDAGCSEFILWFRDAPSDRSLTAWMEGVVPLLAPPADAVPERNDGRCQAPRSMPSQNRRVTPSGSDCTDESVSSSITGRPSPSTVGQSASSATVGRRRWRRTPPTTRACAGPGPPAPRVRRTRAAGGPPPGRTRTGSRPRGRRRSSRPTPGSSSRTGTATPGRGAACASASRTGRDAEHDVGEHAALELTRRRRRDARRGRRRARRRGRR